MRKKLLELIERNCGIDSAEIAEKLGEDRATVEAEIKAMEDEKIICGYNAMINWDKMERNSVTALIEVRVTPQRGNGFDKIAERIYSFPEVKSIFLMSGAYDFMIVIEGENIKEVSFFVSDKLSTIDAVTATATHFVLKKYKEHGVIMDKKPKSDERMIVSP